MRMTLALSDRRESERGRENPRRLRNGQAGGNWTSAISINLGVDGVTGPRHKHRVRRLGILSVRR